MKENFYFTKAGEKNNINNFEKFKQDIASFQATIETASLPGLAADERQAIKAMLEQFNQLKNFNSVEADKRNRPGTHQLSSFLLMPAFKAVHEAVNAFQETTTATGEIEDLVKTIEKKQRLRETLKELSAAIQDRLSYKRYLSTTLAYYVQAIVYSFAVGVAPAILFAIGIIINPVVLVIATIIALGAAVGVFGCVYAYYNHVFKKLQQTTAHPLKKSIEPVIEKLNANLDDMSEQLDVIGHDQKLHENLKANRLEFFGLPEGDIKKSACYQQLLDKRELKLQLLTRNLEEANEELEAVTAALAATHELIDENNNIETFSRYETLRLANQNTDEITPFIKSLSENAWKQTVAEKLAREKKALLKAAIKAHQDPEYVSKKYQKYDQQKFSAEKITELSHQRYMQNAYGKMSFGVFEPETIKVSPCGSNPNKRYHFCFFEWHTDHSKNIKGVNSLKLNYQIGLAEVRIQKEIESERRTLAL